MYLFLSVGHIYRAQLLHGSGRPKAALDELLIASGQYCMWKWKWTLTLYWKHSIYLYCWSVWIQLQCWTLCCTALYVLVTSIWKKSFALTLFCSQPFLSNFLLSAFHSISFIFLYSFITFTYLCSKNSEILFKGHFVDINIVETCIRDDQ